jgi:hypothetical protein
MLRRSFFLVVALLAWAASSPGANAEGPVESSVAMLHLTAALGSGPPLAGGLRWRIFSARAEADGAHSLVAESNLAQPTVALPPGDYVLHVAFGLASATRSVTLAAEAHSEQLTLAAGALRIHCTIGDAQIDPSKLALAIYVPERNNSQAQLVYAKARAGDVIGVPEGTYHIASTYLDAVGVGSVGVGKPGGGAPSAPTETNSIVSGDVRVAAGKIVDVTLRHRFATLTIKLVNTPGAEALANTNFTVLTPGGDIIRELIGAFPSLVLAEGEYVVIARHDSKTYQATFQVQSGLDRDVEVIAQESVNQGQ